MRPGLLTGWRRMLLSPTAKPPIVASGRPSGEWSVFIGPRFLARQASVWGALSTGPDGTAFAGRSDADATLWRPDTWVSRLAYWGSEHVTDDVWSQRPPLAVASVRPAGRA